MSRPLFSFAVWPHHDDEPHLTSSVIGRYPIFFYFYPLQRRSRTIIILFARRCICSTNIVRRGLFGCLLSKIANFPVFILYALYIYSELFNFYKYGGQHNTYIWAIIAARSFRLNDGDFFLNFIFS